MHASAKNEYGCPLWLSNHGDMLPEVQHRGISGPTKKPYTLQRFIQIKVGVIQDRLHNLSILPWEQINDAIKQFVYFFSKGYLHRKCFTVILIFII